MGVVAEEAAHQVDDMGTEFVEDAPWGQRRLPSHLRFGQQKHVLPRRDMEQATGSLAAQLLGEGLKNGHLVILVVHADMQPEIFCRPDDGIGLGHGRNEGLLAEDMASMRQPELTQLIVRHRRRGDDDKVGLFLIEHRRRVRVGRDSQWLSHRPSGALVDVAHRDKLHRIERCQPRQQHSPGAGACADESGASHPRQRRS